MRQTNRYLSNFEDPYWEVNSSLAMHLDRYGSELSGKKILDFGCGERPFNSFFLKYHIHTIACDLQQNSLGSVDILLDTNTNILPFENGEFDAICLFDVLEHIEDDLTTLNEIHRIIKDDGILLLSVPFMYRFHEIPNDYRRYTPTGLQYLLERCGFDVLEIQAMGSAFFVVDTLLRETKSKFSLRGGKIIRRLAMKIFQYFRDPKDPCPVSPFAFFATARRRQATK